MKTVIARRAFVSFACWLAVLPVAISATTPEITPADVHCGPRCVCFLLDYFKRPSVETVSIIEKMDALDKQPGTTLEQIA